MTPGKTTSFKASALEALPVKAAFENVIQMDGT